MIWIYEASSAGCDFRLGQCQETYSQRVAWAEMRVKDSRVQHATIPAHVNANQLCSAGKYKQLTWYKNGQTVFCMLRL